MNGDDVTGRGAYSPEAGCCSGCGGIGSASDGPCWDCRGTGCAHPPPRCAFVNGDSSTPGGAR